MNYEIKYYDRNNVLKLTLNKWPYYSEFSDLLDWSWEYSEQYGKIKAFRRYKSEYQLNIGIASNYKRYHDELCDIFDADVLANSPGYLEINGWKLPCYIVQAEHSIMFDLDRKDEFVVRAIDSTWIRTNTKVYSGIPSGGTVEELGRNYTYEDDVLGRGYDYGYSEPETNIAELKLAGEDNGYEVMVYGPITNPVIYLDNQPIKVNITLFATERLRIVSSGPTKTIQKLSSAGQVTDAFIYRDKQHSPFISLGSRTILSYGQIRFDFTTIERRSRPTWS